LAGELRTLVGIEDLRLAVTSYYEIGRQYQALLARTGVELKLITTAGSLENLELLRDPTSGLDIALVQGGSVGEATGELESLGTLFARIR